MAQSERSELSDGRAVDIYPSYKELHRLISQVQIQGIDRASGLGRESRQKISNFNSSQQDFRD